MEAMRESWTDDRLDDLREDVNRGFTQLRADMNRDIGRVDADVREVRGELAALNRTMTIGFATIGGGVLASIAATVFTAVLG